jgi:hypothetical protein
MYCNWKPNYPAAQQTYNKPYTPGNLYWNEIEGLEGKWQCS